MELRVSYPDEPGRLASILRTLREAGGSLAAHLAYRLNGDAVGLFVCEKPTEAALALREHGFAIETETVVTVRADHRPGALSHLVSTLEAEKIGIAYTYATALADDLFVVFCTDDNPKAEDVLRAYLILEDSCDPAP
jgi:hypothetical protein